METADYAEFVDLFSPKPKIRDKPQIPQISQMTEAKEPGSRRRKNSSGTKKSMTGDPVPPFFSNL
jgi:hypothetical protein